MTKSAGRDPALALSAAERGFTLIEMMIALMIFGLLAAAGVALLSFSVRAQGATAAKLEDVAAIGRLSAAMSADLAQASERETRNIDGGTVPAFVGENGPASFPMLQFVRGGWSNLDDAPRPGQQKVEYRLDGNALKRISYPLLDGAPPLPAATLLDSVASLGLRYRVAGAWSDRWQSAPGLALPEALEMVVIRTDGTRYRSVFLVGTGYSRPINGGGQPGG